MDSEIARRTAKLYEIAYAETPYILIRAYLQKLLTIDEVKCTIDELILAVGNVGLKTM